jgi:peptide/nickel transport system substrate-binding protein
MERRRRCWMAILALSAVLLITACGSSSSNSGGGGGGAGGTTPTTAGRITIGTLTGPDSLDPAGGVSGADYQWLPFIYAELINYNSSTDALEPGLATSWHWVGAKKLELDLNLRHDVKFQDGTPLNAAAVVYNVKRFLSKGDVANNLQFVTGAQATGPYSVAIHLSRPNAQLVFGLADRAGMMISPTAAKKEGSSFGAHPVGAGPYSFVSQVPNESDSFAAFKDYYKAGAAPRVQNITVQVFQTPTAETTAMQTGNIQVSTQVPTSELKPLQSDGNVDVDVAPGETPVTVYFDGKLKPFNDPRMRLAFNLALDRETIMKAATNGTGHVITELEPNGTLGYVKSEDPLYPVNGDPAKAKALVKAAGYGKGVSFTCYNYPGIGYNITDPIIEQEEAAVGIHVNVLNGNPADSGQFFKGKSGPCMMSAYLAPPNPVEITQTMLWSKSFYDAQAANFGVDSEMSKIDTTYNEAGLKKLFTKVWQTEKTNPGSAPMYAGPYINAYAKNVKGWITSPIEQDNWTGMYYTKG